LKYAMDVETICKRSKFPPPRGGGPVEVTSIILPLTRSFYFRPRAGAAPLKSFRLTGPLECCCQFPPPRGGGPVEVTHLRHSQCLTDIISAPARGRPR